VESRRRVWITYSQVQGATLVDKYRCFELWRLVEQSAKLASGALRLKDKIYACDTFSGVVKAGEEDPDYVGGEHADTSQRSIEEFLYGKLKLDNIEILTGIFPEETGGKVENLKFRFCHIDVDVYQSAKDVTEWIWERLVLGACLYDDYGWDTPPGIAAMSTGSCHSKTGSLCTTSTAMPSRSNDGAAP
jgi:O-methyltransferase